MIHSRLICVAFLGATLSLPANAASTRRAITPAQIAAAISDTGLIVSAEQVEMLSGVVATNNAPALKVESVGPWVANLARVRMDCVASDECLPFVVTVRRRQRKDAEAVVVSSGSQVQQHFPVDLPRSKVVVRAGSTAILLLDGGPVHIKLAVVCLQNGSVGQTIRVAGKGREGTYTAQVCSDGILRGRL